MKYANVLDADFVHVLPGETVVLDTATVNLGGLWIEGTLVFDHTVPSGTVNLNTAYAVVTGTFEIGCNTNGVITRFNKRAHLTLIAPERYGGPSLFSGTAGVNWPQIMETSFAPEVKEAALDRGLVIAGAGRLQIYGADKALSWTTLAVSAANNDTSLSLDAAVLGEWVVNDDLVLASTDFEYADPAHPGNPARVSQIEELDLAGFTGASQITISPSLLHGHFAGTETVVFPGAGQDAITMKAELANLTRSVVIQGESSAYSAQQRTNPAAPTQHLGHVILLATAAGVPYCEVEWAEFRDLGVEAKLGRYPFHFHKFGAAYAGQPQPYLKHCAIHRCVNRFAVVHDTQYVVLEDDVGYDTLSTGFFLEDTIERDANGVPLEDQIWQTQNVTLRGNLGLKVGPQPLSVDLPNEYVDDLDSVNVSVFWIGHPNQKVEGNHAAGAAGHGFYLQPGRDEPWSHLSSGASYFRDNEAHSNGQHGFYHQSRIPWAYDAAASDLPAGSGLVGWKNRRYGIWWRTYGVSLLSGCRVADNKSGIYPASEGRQDAYGGPGMPATCRLTVRDSLILGFSSGNPGEMVNPAEVAAGRSLPQTYFHFKRPDAGPGDANEAPWDTINGLESYDGQNVFEDLRLTSFPSFAFDLPDPEGGGAPAPLHVAGITQAEYNSKYAEDPRNELRIGALGTWKYANVALPLFYRTTAAGLGLSMIRNTVVHDRDGVLGFGADVFVSYADPFFAANRRPGAAYPTSPAGSNSYVFPAADADFAQIEVGVTGWTGAGVEGLKLRVAVLDAGGAPHTQTLGFMPPGNPKEWTFNAPLGIYANDPLTQQTGIYACTPLANPGQTVQTPSSYQVKVQFCARENVATVLALPLAAAPTLVDMVGTPTSFSNEASLSALLASGSDHAYFYDASSSTIYVKTTATLFWGGTADVEGTRNVFVIQ